MKHQFSDSFHRHYPSLADITGLSSWLMTSSLRGWCHPICVSLSSSLPLHCLSDSWLCCRDTELSHFFISGFKVSAMLADALKQQKMLLFLGVVFFLFWCCVTCPVDVLWLLPPGKGSSGAGSPLWQHTVCRPSVWPGVPNLLPRWSASARQWDHTHRTTGM